MRAGSLFSLLLALTLAPACSDDTTVTKTDLGAKPSDGAKPPDGSGGIVTKGTSLSLSCTDVATCPSPGPTTQGTVAATQLDHCNYRAGTKGFEVKFIGSNGGKLIVNIEPFTGDSTYQTTADGKTDVTVDTVGNVPSYANASESAEKCTIVAKSNLSKIQVPATGDANILDITLDVTCPKVVAGGVCDANCVVSPSTFQLAVKGCTVSQ